jgi:hypothetical protein
LIGAHQAATPLPDNGPSYSGVDLSGWLDEQGMRHTRGKHDSPEIAPTWQARTQVDRPIAVIDGVNTGSPATLFLWSARTRAEPWNLPGNFSR